MMLKLLKIKKSKKIDNNDEIAEAVDEVYEELHEPEEEALPQIKLFISVDQLAALSERDEDREIQAKMFLNSKEEKQMDAKVFDDFQLKFEKAFVKLGNANNECPHCKRKYTSVPAEIKKCLGCSKGFFKTKRPQDGQMVLVREDNRELLALQWENIKRAELIERINLDELEKLRLTLESRDNRRYSLYDAHFNLVRQYTAKALLSGRFRLYSSLIYYMAEHDRYKREFAKALMYYFYVFYLQMNGASNSVVFGDKVGVNVRIAKRIESLLKMMDTSILACKDFFIYSIEKATAFEFENLPYSMDEVYDAMVKMCDKADRRKAVPQAQEKGEEEPKKSKLLNLKKSIGSLRG